ncbi:citrate transporter [Hymenobacter aquaticus]|uniref:Citrate transporter n=1 Tax=Hymenobacter aquaticus TaxID=1867101 RepID=A0A4Z0QAU2_9BACT|nr:citrate transporter [Hymenobacter aquaticus]TGE25822.1 citrate transporter [Hymenobacter aquaticus]
MPTLQLLALVGIFALMALLMFLRKLPALLALPLMAVLVALVGGIRVPDVLEHVIGAGAVKLHGAYTVAIFGSMLSVMLQKTRVVESFVKKGAELSGDNPWLIAVSMLAIIALLFTTVTGLGAIIMVATIVLPILSSVGIGGLTTVGIFLFGLSIGGTLNATNWAVYVSVMGLQLEQVRPFALLMFGVSTTAALIYITAQLYRDGQELNLRRIITGSLLTLAVVAGLIGGYHYGLTPDAQQQLGTVAGQAGTGLKWATAAALAALALLVTGRAALSGRTNNAHDVHWSAYFSPLIPLLLILLFEVNFIAAFILGLLYAFVSTYRRGSLNLLIQAALEGGAVVMPAVVLMFGIGMLLVAIMGPGTPLPAYPGGWPVLGLLQPLLQFIQPHHGWSYVLIFTLAAPLALYRGPLNVWGMGYGLAAVFLASGFNPLAIMGLLMAVGPIQSISDPTNTQNVWLANEMRVDVQKVLWNTLPYTWVLALAGLLLAAVLFM